MDFTSRGELLVSGRGAVRLIAHDGATRRRIRYRPRHGFAFDALSDTLFLVTRRGVLAAWDGQRLRQRAAPAGPGAWRVDDARPGRPAQVFEAPRSLTVLRRDGVVVARTAWPRSRMGISDSGVSVSPGGRLLPSGAPTLAREPVPRLRSCTCCLGRDAGAGRLPPPPRPRRLRRRRHADLARTVPPVQLVRRAAGRRRRARRRRPPAEPARAGAAAAHAGGTRQRNLGVAERKFSTAPASSSTQRRRRPGRHRPSPRPRARPLPRVWLSVLKALRGGTAYENPGCPECTYVGWTPAGPALTEASRQPRSAWDLPPLRTDRSR